MALKGLDLKSGADPSQRTAFRTSWMQPEGGVGAHVMEGKIVNINLATWTVDFISQFDQKFYFNVQVASSYMHSNSGEGIYAFPEVGSKCMLCIPSDGPPPFILAFIMPVEVIPDTSTDEAPSGTQSRGGPSKTNTGASFAGGRVRPKPGDIYIKGRDGNFCILHRGGVLEIGATELAQRIYIPLRNLITDISQNYHHYNSGGAIVWGVQDGPSETKPPTSWKQTFRLLANEEKGTVRVAVGKFSDVVQEQDTEDVSGLNQLDIGTDEPIVCEVILAPEAIEVDSGTADANTSKKTKLRFFFDKKGGSYLRCDGSLFFSVKKKLRVVANDDIDIIGRKNFKLIVSQVARIQGGKLLELSTDGGVVKLNAGSKPVATVGSQVLIAVPPGLAVLSPAGTPIGIVTPGFTMFGTVTTGNPTVQA